MAASKTKMVKIDSINRETLRAAKHRADYRDDPCAEYSIGDGWLIVASDVSKALRDDEQEIKAYRSWLFEPVS